MIASNFDNFLTWFPAKNFNWIYNWMSTGWHTEGRYPLTSEKLALKWSDPESVVGVRFQAETRYALLDIDSGSPYHPHISSDSIFKIEFSLEAIGINRIIWIQSSDSGGLHGYIAFPEPIKTYKTAQLIHQTLQANGFTIKQGILEIFPNCKGYSKTSITQYNGHRLPLQPGTDSYLLAHNFSGGFNKISSDISQWHLAMLEAAKCCDFKLFKTKLDDIKINRSIITHQYSSDAAKWRQDLENLVQRGWTASGQTNEILFNLLQLGVVFNSLEGEKLINWMVQTAQLMPGFYQFCGHRNDINDRCSDWVKWNERHQRYLPYVSHPSRKISTNSPFNSNQIKSLQVRERIIQIVNDLKSKQLQKNCKQVLQIIIDKSKQLFNVGISLTTLYKYRDLWDCLLHPQEIQIQAGCVTAIPLDFEAIPQKLEVPQTLSHQAVTHTPHNEGVCSAADSFSPMSSFQGGMQGGELTNDIPLESPLRSVTVPSGTSAPQSNFQPPTSSKNEVNVLDFPKHPKRHRLQQRLQEMMGRIKDRHFQVFPDDGIDFSPPVPPLGFEGG